MIQADLNWVANMLATQPVNCPETALSVCVESVSTDSRTIGQGQLFVALQGPNFNGNEFIQQVAEKGAIAAVVTERQEVDIPQFVVANTTQALGQLGKAVAEAVDAKTIAITGSVGKTSVKEMCSAILSQCGNVLATNGNFNNEIGVPLTLLRLESSHDFAVVELGANHLGEIAYTTSLTQPDVAILNNVAEAHLEGFGDIMGVVRAKGEIFTGLTREGVAIVNGDSEFKDYWLPSLEKKFEGDREHIVQFSLSTPTEAGHTIWAEDIDVGADGCAHFVIRYKQDSQAVSLVLPGKHNVANALAAAAACIQVGASLAQVASGLSSMSMVKGRVNRIEVKAGLTIIDDSYNANVRSVKAGIDLLSSLAGNSILVLGDMGELGQEARRYHQEVGEYAKQCGVSELYSFGVLSQSASDGFGDGGVHFGLKPALMEHLHKRLLSRQTAPLTVLVKGSRSAKMEQVIEHLVEQFTEQSDEN